AHLDADRPAAVAPPHGAGGGESGDVGARSRRRPRAHRPPARSPDQRPGSRRRGQPGGADAAATAATATAATTAAATDTDIRRRCQPERAGYYRELYAMIRQQSMIARAPRTLGALLLAATALSVTACKRGEADAAPAKVETMLVGPE